MGLSSDESDHTECQDPFNDDSGPMRSPPRAEFILFSEMGRALVSCTEINDREGVVISAASPRAGSLVVLEATDEEGGPCGVRFVGRVTTRSKGRVPQIRVRWLRATSGIAPAPFVQTLEHRYGFALSVRPSDLSASGMPTGTEYDFSTGLLTVKRGDASRGDPSSGTRHRTVDVRVSMKCQVVDPREVGEDVGAGATLIMHRNMFEDDS